MQVWQNVIYQAPALTVKLKADRFKKLDAPFPLRS